MSFVKDMSSYRAKHLREEKTEKLLEALPEAERAAGAVELEALLSELTGRLGSGTLLLGFRNLVEAATKDLGKEPLGRRVAIWKAAKSFLLESSPASGVSQSQLRVLVEHYHAAAEKDPIKAFAKAQQAARAPYQAAIAAAVEQLAVQPRRWRADAPGALAQRAMASALTELLGKHPVGPQALIELIENLNGKMIDRIGVITPQEAAGYDTIAKVIRLVAGQPAAEAVLSYIFRSIPKLATQTKALAIFDRLKTADSIPRAILEGRSVHLPKDVREHAEGLLALDRLPPTLVSAAALAILPYLTDENAGPLLNATTRFARGAETIDQLDRFAKGFDDCYQTISNYVGTEQGEWLAAALSAELDGKPVGDRALAVGRAGSRIAAILPDVPLVRLVSGDRAQEAGILQLEELDAQQRSPINYALQLLQTIADEPNLSEDAKASLARRAILVGIELAKLDRDPEQVIPQVVADWSAALDSPKRLEFALKGDNGPAFEALKRGATTGKDPAAAAIRDNEEALKAFIDFFPESQKIWNLPSKTWREPLLAWLRAHAEGTLTEFKYGKLMLPEGAKAIWIGEGVTSLLAALKSPPRRLGVYATDDHRLDTFLTSFGAGSSLDPARGFNRPCIVEKMVNGRYKMIRAMNGAAPQGRAFLRLLDVKVGNYLGYALWMDRPLTTPGGNLTPEASQLMYRHALDKAMAMSVPFFAGTDDRVNQAAKVRGLKVEALSVTVRLDRGVTGNHHCEGLAPIAPYGVRWPGSDWAYGHQTAASATAVHEMTGVVSIVFPKGIAH